jgi:hypothetical protein
MAHHRKASRRHGRKASRKHSRKASHKTRRATRRSHRKQRGGEAPVGYDLANSWSSKASLAQGTDFFKYHAQQHGGSAPYPAAVSGTPFLPPSAQGPAMMNGLTKAMADIAGLTDPQPRAVADMGAVTAAPTTQDSPGAASMARGVPQTGGRKRRHSRKHHSRKHRRSSKRHHASHRRHRHRGGGLGYASVSAPGMLLPSSAMYSQAGLNPSYRTGGLEVQLAEIRDQQ